MLVASMRSSYHAVQQNFAQHALKYPTCFRLKRSTEGEWMTAMSERINIIDWGHWGLRDCLCSAETSLNT